MSPARQVNGQQQQPGDRVELPHLLRFVPPASEHQQLQLQVCVLASGWTQGQATAMLRGLLPALEWPEAQDHPSIDLKPGTWKTQGAGTPRLQVSLHSAILALWACFSTSAQPLAPQPWALDPTTLLACGTRRPAAQPCLETTGAADGLSKPPGFSKGSRYNLCASCLHLNLVKIGVSSCK